MLIVTGLHETMSLLGSIRESTALTVQLHIGAYGLIA